MLDISYSCAVIDNILTDTARRKVPLREQSFSFISAAVCGQYLFTLMSVQFNHI